MLQILDVKAIWIKEFASALAVRVQTLGWLPQIENAGLFVDYERAAEIADPPLRACYCPLQRGFARAPVSWLANEGGRLYRRLARQTGADEARSPLVCTAPHYAPVAERWRGPVVYYVTDMLVAYGESPRRIKALDRRMCRRADLVCPNSRRIADYLVEVAHCAAGKIVIVPNATRAANIPGEPMMRPDDLPGDVDLPRPVAGVIGNMAANIDWVLLEQVVGRTPWLSWLFVGPTEMPVPEIEQHQARRRLIENCGGRVRFVGSKPYGRLRDYARALDVAVLPYRKKEPTYSGSSTRFYEHLPTCRPMIATRGFEELLHKEPLLRLIDAAAQMTRALDDLRAADFSDGYELLRWRASLQGTWEVRAETMLRSLAERSDFDNQAPVGAQRLATTTGRGTGAEIVS